jgi:CBS domain containing-hemolysin-like protein
MSALVMATACVLVVSCVCSLLEAVLYSLSSSQVEMMVKQNRVAGEILKRLTGDVQRPISAILSLNTLANTGGAAIAGAAFVGAFPQTREAYFTIAISLSVLVFSEIIPKTAGVVYSLQLAPVIARPLQWLVGIFTPFIWLNQFITRLITRGVDSHQVIAADEIQVIARMSRQAGSIAPEEERVIRNILNLGTLRARDVMTPRTVVFALDRTSTLGEARLEAGQWPHSRVPLYEGDRESMVGQVLRRDVFSALADGSDETRLADLQRPLHIVPESARANQLLADFLGGREHLFGVVDEYGVFSGIVTLEDVLEEIVGVEIVGEFDPAVDMQERARSRGRRIRGKDEGA